MRTVSNTPTSARSTMFLATALTALAGFLDAVGYAELNNLFVSFMSGNSTRLGTAIASGDTATILVAITVLAAFVVGAGAGGFVLEKAGRAVRAVLAGELLLLAIALTLIWLGQAHIGLCLVAAAMGLQNAAVSSTAGVSIGKSFMTGTLVSFGQGLGRGLARGCHAPGTWAYGLSWLTFLASVVIGALAWTSFGLILSLTIAMLLVASLLALSLAGWFQGA